MRLASVSCPSGGRIPWLPAFYPLPITIFLPWIIAGTRRHNTNPFLSTRLRTLPRWVVNFCAALRARVANPIWRDDWSLRGIRNRLQSWGDFGPTIARRLIKNIRVLRVGIGSIELILNWLTEICREAHQYGPHDRLGRCDDPEY
jgi:hypothetical protein